MSDAGSSSGLSRRGTVGLRTLVTVALASAALLSFTTSASASHYRLGESGLVTDTERTSLVRVEVRTTADLVERAGPKRARKALAGATRISVKRLWSLAQTCDLLRVKGLGMSMAKLLRAGGVRDASMLASQKAGALAERLKATNGTHKIAPITPDTKQLSHWIAQAKGLRKILEAP